MKKLCYRAILLVLSVVMIVSFSGNAVAAPIEEIQPYSSSYLSNYLAYTYAAGNGKVQVWFSITGTPKTNEIGAMTIILKESSNGTDWTTANTFQHTKDDDMLFYGKDCVTSHVDYDGTAGRYYYAIVTIWGGADGVGDSRRITTKVIQAT